MNKHTFDQKVAQLKFLRRKKINKRNREFQKKRNKQLLALGMLIENSYKFFTVDERQMFVDSAYQFLTGRQLGLALDGFARLNKTLKARE